MIEAKLLCLKAFDVHNAAQAPDCQAAESHIRITLMNRFLALGTAEIVRVTQNLTGEDHHAAGFSNATTPQLPEISELSIAIEMRQALAQGSCRLSTEGQLRELSRLRSAIFRPRMSAEKASACIRGTDLPSAATVARWLSSKVFTSE